MKERPILFTSDMVKAILDGRKTETRRVIKPQPVDLGADYDKGIEEVHYWPTKSRKVLEPHHRDVTAFARILRDFCPYGKPGERLWVRERWTAGISLKDDKTVECADFPEVRDGTEYLFGASDAFKMAPGYEGTESWARLWKCRSPIFMPRWASRLLLEVTEVKVERVQEIDEAGAVSEGVPAFKPEGWDGSSSIPRMHFSTLWDSINKKRGYSWESNPWVWVVKFKVIEKRGGE